MKNKFSKNIPWLSNKDFHICKKIKNMLSWGASSSFLQWLEPISKIIHRGAKEDSRLGSSSVAILIIALLLLLLLLQSKWGAHSLNTQEPCPQNPILSSLALRQRHRHQHHLLHNWRVWWPDFGTNEPSSLSEAWIVAGGLLAEEEE